MLFQTLIFTLVRSFFLISFTISKALLFANPPDTLDHFPSYRIEGGKPAFYDKVGKTIIYPYSAIQSKIVGTSVMSFVLAPDGKITDYQIVNSLSKDIDYELVKAFKEAEDLWLPDAQEDKHYIIFVPIIFLLNDTEFPLSAHEAGFMMEEIKIEAVVANLGRANNYNFHLEKAKRSYEKRRYRKALRHLNELIERNPFSAELYKLRGFSHYKLNKQKEACLDYQKIKTLLHQAIPPAARNICIGDQEQ